MFNVLAREIKVGALNSERIEEKNKKKEARRK